MLVKRVLIPFGLAAAVLMAQLARAGDDKAMNLHDTVSIGSAETVRSMLANGADIEMRDAEGRTPLLLATRKGDVETARLLIEAGADVNARDSIEDTPFLYAGAEGRDAILRLILATGKVNLLDVNRYGGVALIPAAHHGHPSTVRILLGTDIDIDHVNNLGWTALLEAVILGDGGPVHQEIVGLLVDAGANPAIADRDGVTPLEHAQRRNFTAMADRIAAGPRS